MQPTIAEQHIDEVSEIDVSQIPAEMRALVLSGKGLEHLELRTVPTPKPGPNQLLARVDAAGICTSLVKLIAQGSAHSYLYGWDIEKHPIILGDEGSVTLVAIGEALTDSYRSGDRYVVQPAVDHAPLNHPERYHHDGAGVHKVAVGYTLPGHLAEYLLITEETLQADCLLPVPDDAIPYAYAAMSEPFSCVVSGQDHHLHLSQSSPLETRHAYKGLRPGGVTLIVGAGAMGRMHLELALSYRPGHIIMTDFIAERLERVRTLLAAKAEKAGVALHLINAADTDVTAFLDRLTDHQGADDVIVAVGSPKAAEAAQSYVARGGVLNLFGGFKKGQETFSLDGNTVHYRETVVTGSSGGSPWDVARTLELLAQDKVDMAPHITRIGDLAHAPEFIRQVSEQKLDGKAVVYPHRRSTAILKVDRWTAADERRHLEG